MNRDEHFELDHDIRLVLHNHGIDAAKSNDIVFDNVIFELNVRNSAYVNTCCLQQRRKTDIIEVTTQERGYYNVKRKH